MTAHTVSVGDLKIKIFGDAADLTSLLALSQEAHIRGFTTNPTLMSKAGVRDYRGFARQVLDAIRDRPVSFEVVSDEFPEMERQARELSSWGPNVYVKIPVTNTRGEPSFELVQRLSRAGIKLNVTALLSLEQVRSVAEALRGGAPSFVSVFAGRVADTGRDPIPLMAAAVEMLRLAPSAELIWASPREILNIFHAEACGCHVITITPDILRRLALLGRDLTEYSLDTVRMFHDDACRAGLTF